MPPPGAKTNTDSHFSTQSWAYCDVLCRL